jgi:hypothetical protein
MCNKFREESLLFVYLLAGLLGRGYVSATTSKGRMIHEQDRAAPGSQCSIKFVHQ